MDERKAVLWLRIVWGLFALVLGLLSVGLMFGSFFSLGDEPMKAVAFAVLALYFQRAADGMKAADRRERREESEEMRKAA